MSTNGSDAVTSTVDSGFNFGLNADSELYEKLADIPKQAEKYTEALKELNLYFNSDNLWKGKDAEELRVAVVEGPLKKLNACEQEMLKLSSLAANLKKAVDEAQINLSKNISTAMGVGDGNA